MTERKVTELAGQVRLVEENCPEPVKTILAKEFPEKKIWWL
jgi:hypothetical protein